MIFDLIRREEQRQRDEIELIPSENYVSRDVLAALGSVFTNKYSEGYPRQRYYGGQEFTDQIEEIAIRRAKELFHADHANVQPHSGAQANNAVYFAWCEPGDTILGLDLGHGGHLTHGAPVTQSAKFYNFISYKIKDVATGEFDYEEIARLSEKFQPKIVLVGYSAYSRVPDFARIATLVREKSPGSLLMADMAHVAGLIAAGEHPNPLDLGFHVMTTTTHKTLRGPRGGLILSKGKIGNPLKKPAKTLENLPTLIDRAVFPGTQGGPQMNVIAAKAVSFREAAQTEFKLYAKNVKQNAQILAQELKKRGFSLVFGGTDNHLILIDMMKSFSIDGKTAEIALDQIGLNANANAIPNDALPKFRPSGLRIGTPAITTRGIVASDMPLIAEWIFQAISHCGDATFLAELREKVRAFADQFPLPSDEILTTKGTKNE